LRQQQIQAISNIITGNRAAQAQERAAGADGGGFFQELFNLGAFDKFGSAG